MKKITIFLYVIVFVLFLMGLDYVCVRFIKTTPFLAIKNKLDGENKYYKSLLYDVYYCTMEDGSFERIMLKPNTDYKCREIFYNDFEIIYEDKDTYDPSVEEVEIFYEDEDYTCTFKGNRSDKVFLKYNNGDYINIKNALRRNDVNIETLIEKGINCDRKALDNEVNKK